MNCLTPLLRARGHVAAEGGPSRKDGATPYSSCLHCEFVTLNVRERLKGPTVTKSSRKLAQIELEQSKSRKLNLSLSHGWQTDLVKFSAR
jgi:hypothetical protein